MLGSNHVGERDNAAQLLARFLSARGLTWGDVLARSVAGGGGLGMGAFRSGRSSHQEPVQGAPFDGAPFRAGRTRRPGPAGDAVWRWSMFGGLALVGAMSLTMLLQQSAIEQRITAPAGVVGRCPAGSDGGAWPLCGSSAAAGETVARQAVPTNAGLVGSRRKPGAAFAQGMADRKVADTWRKLAPPGLCGGPFGSGQEDYKAACNMAEKLLTRFEQRRRSDPEYRRGWNSPPT